MRVTVELREDAYRIANAMASEQKLSLGQILSGLSDLIVASNCPPSSNALERSAVTGLLTFRSARRVTSEDVKALEDDD